MNHKPCQLELRLNDYIVSFELDTGSHLSTVNLNTFENIPNASLDNTKIRAKAYCNASIDFLGETHLNVIYNNQSISHKFLVVPNDNVCLLGRDLLQKLNIKLKLPQNDVNSLKSNVESKYKDYFSDEYVSSVKETVKLPIKKDATPVFCKPRAVPLRHKALVQEELDRLEKSNVVTKVLSSNWSSPMVAVLKSDNKVRLCGDYSGTINKFMDITRYPLPTIDDVIVKVGNAKYFSKIDLQTAFLQVPLDDESKEYTCLNTPFGIYRYNFLPFGTNASPAIFQNFVCKVLSNIDKVIIYQDDILIMTESSDEHRIILEQVIEKLRDAGIKINKKKCDFFTETVEYLGLIFDKNGVHPNKNKVRAILEAPSPTNIKEVQSFVGLCGFYRRFIKNFSSVFSPLYDLLKKDAKFRWRKEHQKCFDIIKKLFKTDIVLKNFDPNLPTAIETDASSRGIGACLMQKHADGWFPTQFASRSLNAAERNYSQIEREALSVLFGVERFKNFVLGSKFVVKNDHNPLKKLFGSLSPMPVNVSARLKRWALRLSQFDFTLEYIKGKDNVNGDFLSRLPLEDTSKVDEPYELIFVIKHLNSLPVTCHDIKRHTDEDKILFKIKSYLINGFPSSPDPELKEFNNIINEISLVHGCLMFRNRVIIPKSIRNKVLNCFHENHPGISAMKNLTRALIWYPGLDTDVGNICKQCKICQNLQNKPPQNNTVEWPMPEKKWSRIHVDHFFYENKIFFVAVDALTKYIECKIVNNTSSAATIKALREIFSNNGLPHVLVSDNASSFCSSEFKQFLSQNNIEHMTPPPYSPQSNGLAERSVRTLKSLLKKNASGDIHTRLCNILLYYRSTPHSITKLAPSVYLNNRKLLTLKDQISPNNVVFPKKGGKVIKSFNVGDHVLALSCRPGKKWYKGLITEKLGINIYNVFINELDETFRRHANQLLTSVPDQIIDSQNDAIDIDSVSIPDLARDSNDDPDIDSNDDVKNEPDQFYDAVTDDTPIDSGDITASEICNDLSNVSDELRRSNRIRKPPDRYQP